jgi:hypothetical protein
MFNLITGLASIIGLGVSIWTLVVATGARKAASEARTAVFQGNAAEEFKNLSRIADEFLSHVESDQVAEAVVRARDLMSATSLASKRWSRFLTMEERTSLEEAYGQISVISRTLSTTDGELTPQKKAKLLKFCHPVVQAFSSAAGALFSKIEGPEEPLDG